MDQLHQENPATVTVIAWHNGDEFEFPEGMIRDGWYSITGYPTVWFDGWQSVVGGYTPTSYPYYVPVYEERIGTPSNFSIEMEITNTDVTDYYVSATFEILEGINTENLATFVVLTETDLESPGSENQNFVARNVWPDAMGAPIDFSTQTIQTVNTVITLEDDYVFENCEVIVFLQNMDTKEIYQATSLMMTDLVGIDKKMETSIVSIYPNPAIDRVNIKAGSKIERIEIFNHLGQLAYQSSTSSNILNIDISGMKPGIYFFKLLTKEGTITKQVMID